MRSPFGATLEFLLLLTYFRIMLPKYIAKHSNAFLGSTKCLGESVQYGNNLQCLQMQCKEKEARGSKSVCSYFQHKYCTSLLL